MDPVVPQDRESIIESAVQSGAYLGWRNYKQYMTLPEARSVAWEWVYQHPRTVTHRAEDGERGAARLRRSLAMAVERAGRAEKALQSGYHPDDEGFYTPAVIESVLPVLWDPDYRPWRERDISGRTQSGDSTYMEWETVVADVRNAFENGDLGVEEKDCLRIRYSAHLPYEKVGQLMGFSHETARERVLSGLRRMQRFLGGGRPDPCRPDCEDCVARKEAAGTAGVQHHPVCDAGCCDRVGSRRVLSNAEARFLSDSQVDGEGSQGWRLRK